MFNHLWRSPIFNFQFSIRQVFFLQPKVNASFYGGSNLTFAVRQSTVQVIMKLDRGFYGIVDIGVNDKSHVMVMCSWEDFFKKHFTSPDHQLAKFYSVCPKLGQALCGESDISFIREPLNAFGMLVPFTLGRYPTMFLSDEIIGAAQTVLQYNLDIRREIITKIPFPQWKHDLCQMFWCTFLVWLVPVPRHSSSLG